MAAGTLISSVTSANLSMSFRSQYVTASLNAKARAMPRGVMRGFRPVPGAGVDEVDLIVDPIQSDSVMNAVGVLNNKIYALTYRVDTTITLDFSALSDVGGVRYYIAFVPNYTIGNTTDGSWRAYTEAEFEGASIDSDGGVFLFAIDLPDADAIPLLTDILMGGQSTTTFRSFLREDQQDWSQAGGREKRKLVVNWVPSPIDSQADDSGTDVSFDDTDYVHGRGSILYATTLNDDLPARLKAQQIPCWTDTSDAFRPKIIVQFWYKTDVTFASGGFGIDVDFYDEVGVSAGSASAENSAGRAPTYRTIPNGASGGWKLLRYEVTVPDQADVGSPVYSAFLSPTALAITVGALRLGPVQVWVESEFTSQGGFNEFSGEKIADYLVATTMLMGPSVPGLPASPNSQYWKMYASGGDIEWIPRPNAGTSPRVMRIGATSYGGPQSLELGGDDSTSSYLFLNNYRQIRHAGTGALAIRGSGGADDRILDVRQLLQSGASDPISPTVPAKNTQYAINQIKAWGYVSSDGVGGVTLEKGFGCTVDLSTSNFRITLDNAMSDTNYIVMTTPRTDSDTTVTPTISSTTQFLMRVETASSGALRSVAVNAEDVMFVVIGEAA